MNSRRRNTTNVRTKLLYRHLAENVDRRMHLFTQQLIGELVKKGSRAHAEKVLAEVLKIQRNRNEASRNTLEKYAQNAMLVKLRKATNNLEMLQTLLTTPAPASASSSVSSGSSGPSASLSPPQTPLKRVNSRNTKLKNTKNRRSQPPQTTRWR